MDRILAFILIGLIGLGNSFSHAHDDCHSDHQAGVAHVHLGIACSHESKGHVSHCHKHGHSHEASPRHSHVDSDAQGEEWRPTRDSSNDARTLESSMAMEQGSSECYGNIGCSSCDHLIWVANYTSFIKENHDSFGHAFCNQEYFTQWFEGDCRTSARDVDERFRPRYSIPIYLRHSALLI